MIMYDTFGTGPCWTYFSVTLWGEVEEFGIIDTESVYDWHYSIWPGSDCTALLNITDNDSMDSYELPKNWFIGL